MVMSGLISNCSIAAAADHSCKSRKRDWISALKQQQQQQNASAAAAASSSSSSCLQQQQQQMMAMIGSSSSASYGDGDGSRYNYNHCASSAAADSSLITSVRVSSGSSLPPGWEQYMDLKVCMYVHSTHTC